MATGGWFHKKDVSILGTYYFMGWDWKKESKGVNALKAALKKEQKHLKTHNIESIQRDFNNIDKGIDEVSGFGYKLALRDLLLFRMTVLHLRILARDVHQNLLGVEKAEEKLRQQVKGSEIEREIENLLKKDQHVEDFVNTSVQGAIKEAHAYIQKEQKDEFGLYVELTKGGKAISLTFKGTPDSFWRMMQLRWGAIKRLKSNLKKEEKGEGIIKKEFAGVKEAQNQLYEKIREHRLDLKGIKRAIKEGNAKIDDVMKEFRIIFEAVKNVIKDSYMIFLFDMMLLKVAVENIFTQEQLADAWSKEHQIPKDMGLQYITELQKDQKEAKEHLEQLEKWLQQLWRV
jgi:hypothetical protein